MHKENQGWTKADHKAAQKVRALLRQGPADREQLAAVVTDAVRLGLALGLMREHGEIESDPPLGTPEQGKPRRYTLRDRP